MRRQPRLRQSQPGGRLRRLGFQAYVTASQKPTQVSEDAGDTAVADNLVDAALAVNREQRLDSLGVEYKSLGRDLVRSRHDLGDRREATAYMEKALRHGGNKEQFIADPELQNALNDPQIKALLK